eukprot:CAMPEP_0119399328 /NCGR_PEP_ID=MMETSP1334-20130426/141304_1 /TAXON_ID=127549 /ORGANISM="Calcidiscus leptoporus, Strain RCC1130" /LENGTH=131 /DNA_ID=CAMNT_0007423219 /DNA_START=304 /DNA_END=699 /DNA_ORIENTATION=+
MTRLRRVLTGKCLGSVWEVSGKCLAHDEAMTRLRRVLTGSFVCIWIHTRDSTGTTRRTGRCYEPNCAASAGPVKLAPCFGWTSEAHALHHATPASPPASFRSIKRASFRGVSSRELALVTGDVGVLRSLSM